MTASSEKNVQKSFTLPKSDFDQFFTLLAQMGTVYAAVKVSEQSFAFRAVTSAKQIAFDAIRTILPPKKFFYPPSETLITYDKDGIYENEPELEFKVIFGVHPCDLAGLGIMDKIFSSGHADSHYMRQREASFVIGHSCMPDKHCFCQSMGSDCAKSGYDIFLTDIDSDYFIEALTPAGDQFIALAQPILAGATDKDHERNHHFWETRSAAFTNGFNSSNLKVTMEGEWDNKLWDELGERCLSCGSCTPVCPTCYCFDLVDIASLNNDSGSRKREWDSCQFTGFAKVGGDFNFRPTPVDRLKFWYRHKLHGFDDAYADKTCVGCGRCTVSCPSGIDDIVAVVKALQVSSAAKTSEGADA